MTTPSRDPWLTDRPQADPPRKSATSHSGQQPPQPPHRSASPGRPPAAKSPTRSHGLCPAAACSTHCCTTPAPPSMSGSMADRKSPWLGRRALTPRARRPSPPTAVPSTALRP